MICKNCGTKFDTSNPDENGIVTCPECGKRYRKTVAPKPAAEQTDKEQVKKPAPSGFARFMRYKIGGMLPAWFACLALVAVAVILIVALSGGGGNIEGTWRLTGVEAKGVEEMDDFAQSLDYMKQYGGDVLFTFASGRFTMDVTMGSQSVVSQDGSYRVSGGTLYLTVDGETDDLDYSVSGSTLTLQEDGQKIIFEKK
ncbi:MAG: lipocalin family protein [Clostridia bacterium]|nr:lipocalin family protein [Clostridia bacterium]